MPTFRLYSQKEFLVIHLFEFFFSKISQIRFLKHSNKHLNGFIASFLSICASMFASLSFAQTNSNILPIADPGSNRIISPLTAVQLDGTGSISQTNSALTYAWQLTQVPNGSLATLDNPSSPRPEFTPDLTGNYTATLTVSDVAGNVSAAQTLTFSTGNLPPIAMAGADRSLVLGGSLWLDPEGTYDPNGDRLSANWSILSTPSSTLTDDPVAPTNNNVICPANTVESLGTFHVISATSNQQNPHLAVGEPLPEGTTETGNNSAATYYGPITMDLTGDPSIYVPEGEAIDVVLSSAWGTSGRAEVLMSTDDENYTSLGTVGNGGSAYGTYSSNILRYDEFIVPAGGARFLQVFQQNAGIRADGVIYQTQCQSEDGATGGHSEEEIENASTLIEDEGGRYVFTPDSAGDYQIQLVVEDGQGGQSTDIIDIFVAANDGSADPEDLNITPIARAVSSQLIEIDQAVVLDGSQSTDINGDRLTYQWTILSKPADSFRSVDDATSPIASFTPDTDRLYIIQLAVTDSFGLTSYDTLVLDGGSINPTAISGGSTANQDGAISNRQASVDGSMSRSTSGVGIGLTYQWSVLGLSEGESEIEAPNATSTNIDFSSDDEGSSDATTLGTSTDLLSEYNAIIFNDLDSNVDIGGRTFVGGNIFGNSSTYGTQLPQSETVEALTVIGNMSGGPKNINNGGDVRHGGTISSDVNLNGDGQLIFDANLSIGAERLALLPLSDNLSGLVPNSVAEIPNPLGQHGPARLNAFPNEDGIAVFDIADGNLLFSNDRVQQIEVNANDADAIIINIGGTDINFTHGNFVGAVQNNDTRSKIIWNYYEATDLFFDRAVHGTVLAPNAHLLNRTNIFGAVIVDSLQAHGPISLPGFNGAGFAFEDEGTPTDFALVQLTVTDTSDPSYPPAHSSTILTTGNLRPVADISRIVGENPAEIGEELTLNAALSSDGNSDILSYSWSILSKPSGSSLTLGEASAPSQSFVVDVAGTYILQLIVNDGELDSRAVTYVVMTGGNEAPIANAGPDQTTPSGRLVSLNGGASEDPDGDALTYAWTFISRPDGSESVLNNANSVSPDFEADIPGDYVVSLIVNDGALSSDVDELRVTATNIAPVAVISGPTLGNIGEALTFTGVGSSDADGDTLSYIWTLAAPDGSNLGVVEGSDVAFQFVPDIGGAYSVSLTVSDGFVLSEIATNSVQVAQPNSPPVLSAIDSQIVALGSSVAVQFSANDPDGDDLTYNVSPSPLPAGASLDADSGIFTFSALSSQPDNRTFQVTASDGQASASTSFTLTVTTDDVLVTTYSGQVVDAVTGAPIEGARVFIVGSESTLTDSEGRFTLSNLPPGQVVICVEANDSNQAYAPIRFPVNLIQFADNQAAQPIALIEAADATTYTVGEDIVLESSDDLDVRLEIPESSIGARYWRIRILETGLDSERASIARIVFDNPDDLEPVSAFASSQLTSSSNFAPGQAIGSRFTEWISGQTLGINSWLATDFGEGNIVFPQSVTITSRNSSTAAADSPQRFIVEASNDAENWVAVSGTVVTPVWSRLEVRSFEIDGPLVENGVTLTALTPEQVTNLPNGLEPCGLFVLGPKALPPLGPVNFSTENYDNLPDGTEVDVWVQRNGNFEIVGRGQVTGNRIETVVEGIISGAPIGFAPRFHDITLSSDQPSTYLPRSLLGDGALRTVIGLPSYGSLGGPDTTGLIYNSRAADSSALITGTASFDGTRPETVTSSVSLPGTAQSFENVINVNGQSNIVQSAVVNGDGLESGVYPVNFLSTARYSCSTITASTTARVPLEDGSDNPFGSGWSVAEIQRLDINEQGVSIRQGDGSVLQFDAPIPTVGEDFTDNFGGWGVFGPSEGLTYEPTGGNPGGHLQEVDIVSNLGLVYWQAPEGLLPRLSEFIGGVFTYDMQQNNLTNPIGDDEDLVIETSTGEYLFFDYPDSVFPGLSWTRFEIPLVAEEWFVQRENGQAEVPTEEEFRGLIEQATVFRFRAEHRRGDDITGLDNVAFGPNTIELGNGQRVATSFESVDGDFSTLNLTPDGTFERRYPDGTQTIFASDGLHIATIDRNGNQTSYAYDDNDRVTDITDPSGQVTRFNYVGNNLSSIVDPSGRETIFAYDSTGALVEVTEPDAETTMFTYDENARLISMIDPRGFETTHDYGADGSYQGSTRPDGTSIGLSVARSLGLDTLGTLDVPVDPQQPGSTQTVDGRGNVTTLDINEFGAIIRSEDPLGRVTFYERDENNLVRGIDAPSSVTENGRLRTELDYDNLGNVTLRREAVGTWLEREKIYEYEPIFSQLIRMVDYLSLIHI